MFEMFSGECTEGIATRLSFSQAPARLSVTKSHTSAQEFRQGLKGITVTLDQEGIPLVLQAKFFSPLSQGRTNALWADTNSRKQVRVKVIHLWIQPSPEDSSRRWWQVQTMGTSTDSWDIQLEIEEDFWLEYIVFSFPRPKLERSQDTGGVCGHLG